MKKIITDHKDKIIAILVLLVSFFASLISMGGKIAIFATVMVALTEVVIFYLKEGITEQFINLSVKTILLIADIVNGKYTTEQIVPSSKHFQGNMVIEKINVTTLTEEDVREILTRQEGESNNE